MASEISAADFKDALNRYNDVIAGLSKTRKQGDVSLEELDKFRYQYAPMNFSKNTGRNLELADLEKLAEWKVRHGTFRPGLTKKIGSNSNEEIAAALKDAFDHYASNKDDIHGTVEKLRALKGVGPATASLLLAIHDPLNVVFFSDELHRWLVSDGEKKTLRYTTKEFEELFSAATTFMARINCTPIELEKVAFTLIQESEPVKEKNPYVPTGNPRGRVPLTAEEKEARKYVPTGKPRGRPATGVKKTPSGKPRGRPAADPAKKAAKAATPKKAKAEKPAPAEGAKKRGRPTKSESPAQDAPAAPPKARGRPKKSETVAEEVATTPASNKRKSMATPSTTASSRSTKRAKA